MEPTTKWASPTATVVDAEISTAPPSRDPLVKNSSVTLTFALPMSRTRNPCEGAIAARVYFQRNENGTRATRFRTRLADLHEVEEDAGGGRVAAHVHVARVPVDVQVVDETIQQQRRRLGQRAVGPDVERVDALLHRVRDVELERAMGNPITGLKFRTCRPSRETAMPLALMRKRSTMRTPVEGA